MYARQNINTKIVNYKIELHKSSEDNQFKFHLHHLLTKYIILYIKK